LQGSKNLHVTRTAFECAARGILSFQACSLPSGFAFAGDDRKPSSRFKGESVQEEETGRLKAFLIELAVYAVLVSVYVVVVLGLLGDWLRHLYDHSKTRYAVVALLLIIGQGVVLEMVTSLLMRLIRPRNQ
jgi:hypothetical protein